MLTAILHFLFIFGKIKSGNSFPKPLSGAEEQECLKLFAEGDLAARNKLVEHNQRLVAFLAKKYQNITNESEDLISVGTIGLIKAIQTFNNSKGNRLATYASRCIENEILMYIRSLKKYSNDISLCEPMGVDREGNEITLEDKLADENCDIEAQVSLKLTIKELVQKLGQTLVGREREIIEKRYGLGNKEEYTQREIAKEMGISRSYVSRIEKKAVKRLKEKMEE